MLTIIFLSLVFLVLTPWTKLASFITILSLIGYFYYSSITSWIPISLLVLGIVCIILEIFIPQFGLLGIVGFISTISGLYLTTGDLLQTIMTLSISLLTSLVVIVLLVRAGFSFKNWNLFVLNTEIKTTPVDTKKEIEEGMIGITTTPLRPSGKAKFLNQTKIYDVLSSDGHIDNDTQVIIQEIYGTKIIVRKKI